MSVPLSRFRSTLPFPCCVHKSVLYICVSIPPLEIGFPGGASGRDPTCQCRRLKRCGFNSWIRKDPLEEGMATYSSILALGIPWTKEPGRLQSIESQSQTQLKWFNTHTHTIFLESTYMGLYTTFFNEKSLRHLTHFRCPRPWCGARVWAQDVDVPSNTRILCLVHRLHAKCQFW